MRSDLPSIAYLPQGFAMCAHRSQRPKYENLPCVAHCGRSSAQEMALLKTI